MTGALSSCVKKNAPFWRYCWCQWGLRGSRCNPYLYVAHPHRPLPPGALDAALVSAVYRQRSRFDPVR
jgi:hypothetical protein